MKNELIATVQDIVMSKTGRKYSREELKEICDSVIEALKQGVVNDKKIKVRGFGTFEVQEREPRKIINPKTGEENDIPPYNVVTFRAGADLKRGVNK